MRSQIEIFVELGRRLATFGTSSESRELIAQAISENGWFSEEDILRSIDAIRSMMLEPKRLDRWAECYTPVSSPRRVAVIMAGNIPLVGFFDLMCTLLSGHHIYVKPSSKDRVLMQHIIAQLRNIDPKIAIFDYVATENYDLAIATGGEDANRYFSEHFAKTKSLLRSSRHSIAVLDGSESSEELEGLAIDITAYSGLGCRSVAMVFYPASTSPVFVEREASCRKLTQTLRVRKAMLRMQNKPYNDYGGYITTEGDGFSTSLGEVTLCKYSSIEEVYKWLNEHKESIQCVVSHIDSLNQHLPFGRTISFGRAQYPTLDDYADGVDTMAFLTE